jgi:predicted nucleic acid-binding protein
LTKRDIVVIDEQEGRQYAVQAGLSVAGVLGYFCAKKNGLIAALKPEIQALKANARFFVPLPLN